MAWSEILWVFCGCSLNGIWYGCRWTKHMISGTISLSFCTTESGNVCHTICANSRHTNPKRIATVTVKFFHYQHIHPTALHSNSAKIPYVSMEALCLWNVSLATAAQAHRNQMKVRKRGRWRERKKKMLVIHSHFSEGFYHFRRRHQLNILWVSGIRRAYRAVCYTLTEISSWMLSSINFSLTWHSSAQSHLICICCVNKNHHSCNCVNIVCKALLSRIWRFSQ